MPSTDQHLPTIVAIATAQGRGGVGIVRLSGSNIKPFIDEIVGVTLVPRFAHYGAFKAADNSAIDHGIALYFEAPHSFTGEHVLELHAHGGPVVLDMLLERCIELGATMARPGEFSERAFLNDKIDLTQAEAIADLIAASSKQAAESAIKSLQGVFSSHIHNLVEQLIQLRMYVEAAIDFPEEEIDFLADGHVLKSLELIQQSLEDTLIKAQQGAILRDGMTVVLAGKPNAGKSSLLNALSGRETAIVTSIAGTTRDVLKEAITLDGMPLHIIDTAGLRDSADEVEQEGIRRAWLEIEKADRILFVIDANEYQQLQLQEIWPEFFQRFPDRDNVSIIINKIDVCSVDLTEPDQLPVHAISAKHGIGIEELVAHLKQCMGYQNQSEGVFSARRRHINALTEAAEIVAYSLKQFTSTGAGELLAEDLRLAQHTLSAITGEFTNDALLGRIFSSFCIGK